MKTIKIEESKLHFDEFKSKILESLEMEVDRVHRILAEHKSDIQSDDFNLISKLLPTHPSSLIGGVHENGTVEYDYRQPDEARSNFLEKLHAGWRLYFPFASVREGELIHCADGKARESKSLGDAGSVGFLVKIEGGSFIINSAIFRVAPWPGLTSDVHISDSDGFDEPMEDFLRSFTSSR